MTATKSGYLGFTGKSDARDVRQMQQDGVYEADLIIRMQEKKINFQIHVMDINDIDEMLSRGISSAPILNLDNKMLNYKEALKWVSEV